VAALFPDGWSGVVEAAKFHHPVRPGDTLTVARQTEGEQTRFKCFLAETEQLVLSGILRTASPSL
jgi:acyl dehydratase